MHSLQNSDNQSFIIYIQFNIKMNSRIHWTKQEQLLLGQLVQQFEGVKWSKIANKLNFFCLGKKFRTGKQCRQRYINHVKIEREGVSKSAWTHEEEKKFIAIYDEMGSKWIQIASFFPGRSENSLKNRFYGMLRSLIKRTNHALGNFTHQKNTLKYQSLKRVINAANKVTNLPAELFEQSLKIKQSTLKLMLQYNQKQLQNELIQFVQEVHNFVNLTKCRRNGSRPNKKNQLKVKNHKSSQMQNLIQNPQSHEKSPDEITLKNQRGIEMSHTPIELTKKDSKSANLNEVESSQQIETFSEDSNEIEKSQKSSFEFLLKRSDTIYEEPCQPFTSQSLLQDFNAIIGESGMIEESIPFDLLYQ